MWLTKSLPPEAPDALKELKGDLWRLQNDTKSALVKWPFDGALRDFAIKIGVKP